MNEYRFIATNSYGESIDLWCDSDVAMTSLEGVSPESEVKTMLLSGLDGSSFVSSRFPERTISMIVQYREEAVDAEKSKLRLYRVFRPKEKITLRYISPNQDKYVEGYVTKCDTPPTTFPMVSQITVKIPDPYWHTSNDNLTLLCGVADMFEFIKDNTELTAVEFGMTKNSLLTTINYEGDAETGMTVTFEILADVTMIGIRNITYDVTLKVEADFTAGDIVTICTVPKHKSVTLLRNAESTDYLIKLAAGSRFPLIYQGENAIEVLIEGGSSTSVSALASYKILFGGI